MASSKGWPNRAMSVGKVAKVTLLLLMAAILKPGTSQITCNIEIDSANRQWRDTTPKQATIDKPYCTNYRYRETNPGKSGVDGSCDVYYNADTGWPCLATCKSTCDHEFICPRSGSCPCVQDNDRYNKGRMCVPTAQVLKCGSNKWLDDNRQCLPVTCINTCPNGVCDSDDTCACLEGFTLYPKTGKCVSEECSHACQDGVCHTYGECTCTEGFKKDPDDKFKCIRIECPDQDHSKFCLDQCEKSGCTAGNTGRCDPQEDCKCNFGFKKDPSNKYKCNSIVCPDQDHSNYCQDQCRRSSCTDGGIRRCDPEGRCICKEGYKKKSNLSDQCEKITCPSEDQKDKDYCKTKCDKNCKNGTCDQEGKCQCKDGFKNDPKDMYKCDKIDCPDQDHSKYCQDQCLKSNCTAGDIRRCDQQGRCICKEGYKKISNLSDQCDKITCPSEGKDDLPYCTSQCNQHCQNGTCKPGGSCECSNDFKKDPRSLYKCKQIKCPAIVQEDKVYCKTECDENCKNGSCDQSGFCSCDFGFKKSPTSQYGCTPIICPSTSVTLEERPFCASVCQSTCVQGACNEAGECTCTEGFKVAGYTCTKIACPALSREDNGYCKARCADSCTNGKCSEKGECELCLVKCNEDVDCPVLKPRCSQHGFCVVNESLESDCTIECVTQCVRCAREEKDIAICSKKCIGSWCDWKSKNGEDRKWLIATLTIVIVQVAIGIAVWVWRRRHFNRRGGRVAATEHLELDVSQMSGMRQTPTQRECESYLEPRRIPQEEESQYPLYETVADVVPNMVGQGATEQPRHLQTDDPIDVN